jgi:hypothetical protein
VLADIASVYGAMLVQLKYLRCVRLVCNVAHVGDMELRALLPSLAPPTQLEELRLSGCRLSLKLKAQPRTQLRLSKWVASGAEPFGRWDSGTD